MTQEQIIIEQNIQAINALLKHKTKRAYLRIRLLLIQTHKLKIMQNNINEKERRILHTISSYYTFTTFKKLYERGAASEEEVKSKKATYLANLERLDKESKKQVLTKTNQI